VLFIVTSLTAATGKIAGRVVTFSDQEPIGYVSVKIQQLEIGAYTKENGTYLIQNVPEGKYTVEFTLVGMKKLEKEIEVVANETSVLNVKMRKEAIATEGISVSANRAKKRETPIAFTNIKEEEISDKYTTEDMPQLLEDVSGIFANTTGLGDAEITMRGFEADKIQVLINGIPVNDPESQKVYWSNWTGLTSNVKSVQVQKGAGSSLYGSGAFGGSLNIETMGTKPEPEFTIRSSYGAYVSEDKVADGEGNMEDYNPYNYNVLMRYNSGNLYNGKLNYGLMVERKVGDYYITGTNYRGWSFGLDTQHILGNHKIYTNFLGAPQEHNQAYFKSDPDLMNTLGREYNRNNHEYQENYYFKPQFSIRDEWEISDNKLLMTNLFVTKGDGGGKYLSQDKFDINTGEVAFRDGFLDSDDPQAFEDNAFGKHALFLYENYGVESENFCPVDTVLVGGVIPVVGPSYKGELISGKGADFFDSPTRYEYSWRNNQISDHFQFGGNTYFDYQVNNQFKIVCGGEVRSWNADHIGKIEKFRHFNPDFPDSVETYDKMQKNYDYTSHVLNMSAFARVSFKPIEKLNLMADGQIARYASSIDENPIEIYDLGTGEPTGEYFYSTKDITEVVGQDTVYKFKDSDYEKVYSFFSPKFGVNYNISKYFNVRTNYSIAYKEPRTSEWYGYDGPDTRQMYTKNIVLQDSTGAYYNQEEEHFYGELEPEKINTIEFGLGYDGVYVDFDVNYYMSDYYDKIEYVTIPITEQYYNAENDSIETNKFDASMVLNAGKARHQGVEFSSNLDIANFDAYSSLTWSHNRWTDMNVEQIFDMSAEEMEDKVVPFAPEIIINGSVGYTFKNMPYNGKLRFGLRGRYWDGYYANYTNEYYSNYVWNESSQTFEPDSTSIKSSELPYFFEMGADIKYSFKIGEKDAFLKLSLNNILNRENLQSANVRTDYNRGYYNEEGEFVDDYLTDNEYMYVTPAPLFNAFLTAEIKF
jgi:outer membrane receptor protein involved in Fe transport